MSDENELPKCPFCGGEASYTDTVGIGVTTNRYGLCSCADTQCLPEKIIFKVGKWRTRPIEDALRAENERLKAENADLSYRLMVHRRLSLP